MKSSFILKKIAQICRLEPWALMIYFWLLGFKYGVQVVKKNGLVLLFKNDKKIVLSHGKVDYGSAGLVIRDFDAFFDSVECQNHDDGYKVVDFSVLRKHKIRNLDEFYWSHGIIDPENVTDIYLKYSKIGLGSVVLDVGTYCGVQTVRFSKVVGKSGKVFAFEPDKASYKTLLMNLSEHKCDNVIALNYGLFNFDGILRFNGSGGMGASVDQNGVDEVKVLTLKTAIKELQIDNIDFIKMDIEGSEFPVLSTSLDILKELKPRLIVEPHYVNGRLNDLDIITKMKSIGYENEVVAQGKFDHQPLLYFEFEK